ncbi:MAG TPA: hypothetical protein VK550_19240 [Polyangiaceae bacterium]|jgi:hypothetical protein|nr:hypothetical protein [Polyangiaceae bacterium]
MSRPAGKLVVHHRSPGVAIATLDAFFIMRCFGNVTPEDIRATLLGHEALIAYRQEGGGSIVAVDPTANFPSEATRRVALEITRTTGPKTLAHALIVLGDGFWASAMRGVMTTIWSLNFANRPRKVVRQEGEGVDWVIETVGESVPKYRQLLLSALSQLRAGATVPPTALSSSSGRAS